MKGCTTYRLYANNKLRVKKQQDHQRKRTALEITVYPQLLPTHTSHDDNVEDVLGTLAELKGSFVRGEGARSMESGDDRLGAAVEFELVGHV